MRNGQCDQSLIDGRRLLTPRVIGVRLPAQNTVHDNPRVRELLAEALHKSQDSVHDLWHGMTGAEVVRANHHERDLRRHFGKIGMVQSPKHVLGLVAAEAQVDDSSVSIKGVPHRDSVVVFPSFGNGVADDDGIDVSLAQPEVDAFLPLHPPFLVAARCGLSCCMRRPGVRCVWQACAPGDQAPERRGCRCFDGRGQELPTISDGGSCYAVHLTGDGSSIAGW